MTRVIERAEWGAKYRDGFGSRPLDVVDEAWLHHSVTASPGPQASLEADIAAVQQIEAIGQARFQGGISYTFVATQAGRIFRGHSLGRVGAHTAGHNTRGIGIALIGNYETNQVTGAQKEALAWLLQHLAAQGLPGQFDGGHRDTKATACPGKNAYAEIDSINALARSGEVVPTKAGSTPTPQETGAWLRNGSTGGVVEVLQHTLNVQYPAYSDLDEDGQFGDLTEAVVREFQRRSHVTVDGVVGPVTAGRLGLDLSSAPPVAAPVVLAPVAQRGGVYQQGDAGDGVEELQRVLNRWYPGVPRLAEDGDFGPKTRARVVYLQRKAGLDQDGIAGPLTLGVLGLTWRG